MIMSKIKNFFKNISPLNNRTEMPMILYIIKVIIIFWFVKFGSELIGEAIVIGLHFICGKNPLKGEMFDAGTIMLITYYGYGIMIGIMFLYWKLFQKKTLAELGFTKKVCAYFVGAFAGLVLIIVSVVSVGFTGALTYHGLFSDIDYIYIFLMLGGFICQGAMEEVLCRGIVLQLLKDRTRIPVVVGVSTALFIIPHLDKMTEEGAGIIIFAIINLILISIIFSLITLRMNSIWAACGLHTIWNFTLYNILGLNLSGNNGATAAVLNMSSEGSNVLNGGLYGIEASAVTTVVLSAALILFYVVSRYTEKSVEKKELLN